MEPELLFCAEATSDTRVPMHVRYSHISVALCGAEVAYDLPEAKPTAVLARRLHVCGLCREALRSVPADV